MSDLFSDLVDGSGRDYFYDLESAPGGLSPAALTLTISGLAPTIFEQTSVFRSPAVATLTLNGLALAPDFIVTPAAAALSAVGQIPGEYREIVVTPATPDLDYSDPVSNPPTILFVNTVTPTTGVVTVGSLELNVTPGGNIGFIQPLIGSVQLSGLAPVIIFFPVEIGQLSVQGLGPTLQTELILGTTEDSDAEPGIKMGSMTIIGLAPSLERPFTWIDVDPPEPTTWTTTTGVAA